ncbi:MAG: pseudouridine synthase [Comamonas sp.]
MYNSHDPQVLPIRNGVKPSCVVLPSTGQGTCLDYLVQRLPSVSRADWIDRMARGEVVDELARCVQPDTPLLCGLRIYYYREVEAEPHIPFEAEMLYRDEHIVVADKPHFLPVTPGGRYLQNTLLVRLKKQLGLPDLSPVHRIDRDTAGLVLFAVRREDRGAYQALFRERTVHKCYEAIARWNPALEFPRQHASRMAESSNFIRMQEMPAGAPNSFTRMELMEHNAYWARYALYPVSGKRHQLRVHMAALGLGLKGDGLYPVVDDAPEGDFSRPLMLLAKDLRFDDPITGQPRRFTSQRTLGDLPASL